MKLDIFDKLKLLWAWKVIKKKWKELKEMADEDSKPWWQSKTVIGALVQIVISLLVAAFGLKGLEGEKEQITAVILAVANAIDAAWNIYGRVKATKRLTK